jgi:integrase
MTSNLSQADAKILSEHLAWMRLRDLSPATIYHRRRFITRLAAFIDPPLLDATEADLDRWQRDQARLMTRSRLCGISNVSSFYTWLVDFDHRADNPSRVLIRPKRPRGLPHPISEPDLELALAGSHGTRVRAMLVVGAYAGLRCCEIAGLDRADVHDRGDTPVLRILGKGGKERIVPMSDFVVRELRAHGLPQRGPVFPRLDEGRGPNANWTISHVLARYLHDLGIAETAHALRHRFGTMLYAATRDLRLVQEVMGHESPLTTAGYVQFSNVDALAAVRYLAGEQPYVTGPAPGRDAAPRRRSPLQSAIDGLSALAPPVLAPVPSPA